MSDVQHTDHPDVHTHGLADGCPRCEEHAENPTSLDARMLGALVTLALDPSRFAAGRSEMELRAAAVVLTWMERFGKLAETAPDETLGYLRRWGVKAATSDALDSLVAIEGSARKYVQWLDRDQQAAADRLVILRHDLRVFDLREERRDGR